MIFEQIRIGGDRNFAYLVGDESAARVVVVDVGYNPRRITQRLDELGATLEKILVTHSHPDHIGGVRELKRLTGAPFAAYQSVPGVDEPLDNGDTISVGDVTLKVIHCPGHCADSIALLVDDKKLITGDELFVGKIGGTHSEPQARTQYDNLHHRLMTLDDDIEVWPGHDFGTQPHSTIAHERKTNPFLLQPDFESFLDLKNNWAEYKRQHGIK